MIFLLILLLPLVAFTFYHSGRRKGYYAGFHDGVESQKIGNRMTRILASTVLPPPEPKGIKEL